MKVTPVTIDRTINLPFLLTVIASILAATVWTSTVNHRLDRLEERTLGLQDMQERIARMDERGGGTREAVSRIERRLERMEEKQ